MTSSLLPRLRCRWFRARHAEFVDARLCGVTAHALQEHRDRCPGCAAFDTRVRRALIAVSSVRSVEVSPDFAQRLAVRLAAECATPAAAAAGVARPQPRGLRRAAAALVIFAGWGVLHGAPAPGSAPVPVATALAPAAMFLAAPQAAAPLDLDDLVLMDPGWFDRGDDGPPVTPTRLLRADHGASAATQAVLTLGTRAAH